MRLITIILISAILQVSAATYGQKITLSEREAPLVEVFDRISAQSGFDFLVSASILKDSKPVNIQVKNMELSAVLQKLFEGRQLDYSIDAKSIVIRKAESTLLDKIITRFQSIDVRGRVVDENGNPLSGTTVTVKNISKSTKTNAEGEFFLQDVEEGALIVISFVGYRNVEVKAAKMMGTIRLEMGSSDLQEVTINKGYYTTKKELNTGSVARVTASEIERQPVSDPLMALQGRVPGLYIAQTSGVPGAGLNIRLRGTNSIANGKNPLILIDGMPFNNNSMARLSSATYREVSPFMNIRPQDIESIEVLKDADATAIYGSRGANGVILITMKKGVKGKTKVTFDLNSGVGKVGRKFNLMNTQQYLAMRDEAFKNDGITPGPTDYDVNGTWDRNAYTDWQKVLIGGSASTFEARASITGGSQNTQFSGGGAYRKENTVYPGDFSSDVMSGNFSVNHTSENKKLFFNFGANYSVSRLNLPMIDLTERIFIAPNAPEIYNADGSLNWASSSFENPFGILEQSAKNNTRNLINNASITYAPVQGLKLITRLAYNTKDFSEQTIIPFSSYSPQWPDPEGQRQYAKAEAYANSWIVEPQASYNLQWGDNEFDLLAGTTFQENKDEGSSLTANGFTSDVLIKTPASARSIETTIRNSMYKYSAVYARVGWNYKSKYILNLTGRQDGSSRFGADKRFGLFGALGAGWLFSKESFISENLPFLTFGKLRGSIGSTGNDQLTDYEYLSSYTSILRSYQGIPGLFPSRLANSNYSWERMNKIEMALELGFLNDRLTTNISYYINRTSNQLIPYPISLVTGFRSIRANLPAKVENRGLEIELNSDNIRRGDFGWTTTFNMTIPKNKLLSYPSLATSPNNNKLQIGMPLTIAFLYEHTGIDASGLYQFKDQNNDGQLSSVDDRKPYFVGQHYFGAMGNSFRYKNFMLDIFFQYVKQDGNSFPFFQSPGIFFPTGSNQPTDAINRWTGPGSNSPYQKYSTQYGDVFNGNSLFTQSNAVITDASFVRLKNVALSWTTPIKINTMFNVQSIRVFCNAQNLLTWTKFRGIDPETQRLNMFPVLPTLRVINFGIQANL